MSENVAVETAFGGFTKAEFKSECEKRFKRCPSDRTIIRWKAQGLVSHGRGPYEIFPYASTRQFFAGEKPSLPPSRRVGRPRKRKAASAEAHP